ncbi:LysR family transcriptional regulator [Sphingomonas metalli]|uniref:LysR family transcriptional regulator n=1 Tax=Sphingomonas metalli TaxID=1779358 RepID=A0A916SXL0_9SPHN|nr:LysR family transcriptional regulator [Sphingomonas metalli]GGB22148.1 LysR family transcriptional regulator [Sphingomonas metalli]
MDPDIPLFVEVLRAGSLSAAARHVGLSPAMVSKRIARLEARLGTRLITRTTRRLEPTAAGEQFHRDAAAILEALAAAEARVAGRQASPAGPLRVSAPTSFGRMHLAPRLKPFLDAHPGIALELNLSDAFTDLVAERIDLAIRITAAVPPSLVAHRLASSRRILCAAPAYLEAVGAPAELADLKRHRLLAATGQLPWRLTRPGATRLVDGRSHVVTNSSEVVRELTLAGVGVALRSLWDVADALGDGRLVRLLPDWQGSADVGVYAVHPRGAPVPGVAALVDYLRDLWATSHWA